jgi:hypothetical protein
MQPKNVTQEPIKTDGTVTRQHGTDNSRGRVNKLTSHNSICRPIEMQIFRKEDHKSQQPLLAED